MKIPAKMETELRAELLATARAAEAAAFAQFAERVAILLEESWDGWISMCHHTALTYKVFRAYHKSALAYAALGGGWRNNNPHRDNRLLDCFADFHGLLEDNTQGGHINFDALRMSLSAVEAAHKVYRAISRSKPVPCPFCGHAGKVDIGTEGYKCEKCGKLLRCE